MNQDDDSYLAELNQIRERQSEILDHVDRLKDTASGQAVNDLHKIQGDALKIVNDIDEIKERVENGRQSHTGQSKTESSGRG